MIEESNPPTGGAGDRHALLYDYFKTMTSLSLVTLGGVLSISQLPDIEIKPFSLTLIVIALALAGIGGFSGMDEVVRLRFDDQDRPRRLAFMRKLCPAAFGIGIGGFLSAFLRALY